ncbi:MAG TPA: regulatory iron-sulfur-containing complex subunit RicT [Candidatus Binataceae bacterium]
MSQEADPFDRAEPGPKIVALSLQQTGQLHNYLAGDLPLRRGDRVMVESDAGTRIAKVEIEPHEAARTLDLSTLRPIIRLAEDADSETEKDIIEREARARRLCVQRIREHRLAMKLVTVVFSFDGRKAIFYFIAETRIDFRDLVRDLANTMRLRIEMKQIGARDESKVTGGLGPCGRELCCSSWLRDFEAVTVKMAREQGLALNPGRLAGMCGRLKCCLRYEYATYLELKRVLPPVGRRVECVKGDGKVIRQNILKQTVLVQREEDGGVVEATLDELVEQRQQ